MKKSLMRKEICSNSAEIDIDSKTDAQNSQKDDKTT